MRKKVKKYSNQYTSQFGGNLELEFLCLISKEAIRKAIVKNDLTTDKIISYREKIKIKKSRLGHYTLPLSYVLIDPKI